MRKEWRRRRTERRGGHWLGGGLALVPFGPPLNVGALRPGPTPLEAARVRTREAAARVQGVQAALAVAKGDLAEARRAELAELARQPVPLRPTLAAGARLGVIVTLAALGLAEILSGRPASARR